MLARIFACFFLHVVCATLSAEDTYQPRNTQAPGEEPPTAQEAADLITVPEGFQVKLYAGDPDVRQPVAMALDDRGRLYVAESYSYHEWEKKGEDRVLIFEDTDNDGVHDSRKVFTSGIDHMSGMTVGWGGVWVCSAPNLLFYPDKNRDDIPDGEPEIILDGWTTKAKHNFFNGLTWGPDGWLYGRHGITAPSFVGAPGTPEEERVGFDCAIWRYHPVTKEFEVVCQGTTNPWGLDWNSKGDMFFTNNVNGHLWHAIPGAFYPRMGNRATPFAPFVYDRIGMCCDHLHHAGSHTDWTKTRDGKGVHGELGGGHSHCGGMIYLGGKWPEKYHDRMFMCNTHGRRVNVDRLDQEGATYVGRHEADFMLANNVWFRGVQLLYGPDGDVYVSDWVDNGECHDHDGVHRTSGRIYKIIYGDPEPPMKEKLWEMTNDELLAMHEHENEWYARTARWILLERMASGKFTKEEWSAFFPDHEIPEDKLNSPYAQRYFGTNYAIKEKEYLALNEKNAVDAIEAHAAMAEGKQLPSLREYASQLRKYRPEARWAPAKVLLEKTASNSGETMQLLIYYGIKDIAAKHPEKAAELLRAAQDTHPLFTRNLAQNLAENGVFEPIISFLNDQDNEAVAESLLGGFSAGVKGRSDLKGEEGWSQAFQSYVDHPDFRLAALTINLAFDKAGSREKILDLLKSDSVESKQTALAVLADLPAMDVLEELKPLISDPVLGPGVIPIAAKSRNPEVGDGLISNYEKLSVESRIQAVNALCGNPRYAAKLLDALDAGIIPRHAVTAFHARQILTYKDDALKKQLARAWGKTGSTSKEKNAEIKKWQDQLLPDVLAKADLKNGHLKYQQLCMACHNLHGEGGAIGPELTGANRGEVYYLLENIIDPSATLPADFRMTVVTKKDDSVVSGMIQKENEYSVTIKTLTDEQTINLEDIKKRETLEQSIMPEGLLNAISEEDVRDLMGYLQK